MLRCLLKNQIFPLQRKLLYGFLMNTTDSLQFSTDVDFSLSFLLVVRLCIGGSELVIEQCQS